MVNTLQMLTDIAKISCEAITTLKAAGLHNSLLDSAEAFCNKELPDVEKLQSGSAIQIGSAAIDVAAQIKAALTK